MIDFIQDFINSKSLSENSKIAYFYDLQQFVDSVNGKISKEKLALYEQSLSNFKISAIKRKISAVNQFLYFLYETEKLDTFYKLSNKYRLPVQTISSNLLDYAIFYQETSELQGQLIVLLMAELGLSPTDLQELKLVDIDFSFSVLQVRKSGRLRILEIPTPLLLHIENQVSDSEKMVYLFDNQGKAYSRQWFFNRLKIFLGQLGRDDLTARTIRQQYILHQKEAGRSLLEVSRSLGLKSPVTLEKFYR